MSAARARLVVNDWNTVRYELLSTRLCDLKLRIEGSPLEPFVTRVRREVRIKGLQLEPVFYLTDSWGCPNEVPAVGVPFYLADRRLARIELEQTGEIEDSTMVMMFLRHEVGHAVNYAYRLWERKGWAEVFGRFSRPYRDAFKPDPLSRNFVRYLHHSLYGRSYAQKHPDEDFAETFAVWLTPGSDWRRRYRLWPAIHKLRYVARLVRELRDEAPRRMEGPLLNPVEGITVKLAQHYGEKEERFRAAAQGYVDDKLHGIFPETKARTTMPATDLIERHRGALSEAISRWSNLDKTEVDAILEKLESRAAALRLEFPRSKILIKLTEVSTLATALAMDFSYTGRFTM